MLNDISLLIGQPGETVDIAPFASYRYWTGDDPMTIEAHCLAPEDTSDGPVWRPVKDTENQFSHLGLEWNESREIQRVEVDYASPAQIPKPSRVKLQYWQHNWPQPYAGGWTDIDDPFNGRWITAHGDITAKDNTQIFVFDPLDYTEITHANDFPVTHRVALKIRLVFEGSINPTITQIRVFNRSVWKEADLAIEFGCERSAREWSGATQVYNGAMVNLARHPDNQNQRWMLRVRYIDCALDSAERTIITVHSPDCSFSFLPKEAMQNPLWIPEYGVLISDAAANISYCNVKSQLTRPGEAYYDRVLTEPEQTYARASREIPPLTKASHQRYIVLGCDSNRQEFGLSSSGHVFVDKQSLKCMGRDTARLLWAGTHIAWCLGTGDPPDFRGREDAAFQSLLEDCLPVAITRWQDRGIEYEQETFATLLGESLADELTKSGEEASVMMMGLRMRNASARPRTAHIWLLLSPREQVRVENGVIWADGRERADQVTQNEGFTSAPGARLTTEKYDTPRLRAYINTVGKGTVTAQPLASSFGIPKEFFKGFVDDPLTIRIPDAGAKALSQHNLPVAALIAVELAPNESHEIHLILPFETYQSEKEAAELAALDYQTKRAEVIDYWQNMIKAGMQIDIPDKDIKDFYNAVIPHVAITGDKDPVSRLYMLPAGTWGYPVCCNEACIQIRALDMRGHHDRARRYLEAFFALQGSQALHGRFRSQEGVFHGLVVNEWYNYSLVFRYNLDHGFVMWTAGEHYRFTRDAAWLSRVAPNLIAACDFVIREREATKITEANGEKTSTYGLLPPGHLEDNPEFLYWYAVNGYAYLGFKRIAEALTEIGHPEAIRLTQEAEAYGDDMRRALRRSIIEAPVVGLRDGSWVPFVPTRANLRGRDTGWIRDGLYGPVHMVDCELFAPTDPEVTWILKDHEDNVFVKPSHGYDVDPAYWFSHGGFTLQPNLLHTLLAYLKRGQLKHVARVFYNVFCASIYRDVHCFAEWVPGLGRGEGPFYKTPDECGFITWLCSMLVLNEVDCLTLAAGAPQHWFTDGQCFGVNDAATYFGPVTYRIQSRANQGAIEAVVCPPRRNPPAALKIRLRHPDAWRMTKVEINGKLYMDFDADLELINLPLTLDKLKIKAFFSPEAHK